MRISRVRLRVFFEKLWTVRLYPVRRFFAELFGTCRFEPGDRVMTNHEIFDWSYQGRGEAPSLGYDVFYVSKTSYWQHGWVIYGHSDKKGELVWYHQDELTLMEGAFR